jgi:hypothetical protein
MNMPQGKRSFVEKLLSELTHYVPVDNGYLEIRTRYVTRQEYLDQNKREAEASALTVYRMGGDFTYKVSNSKGDGSYLVDLRAETCECPDFRYRAQANRMKCKHLIAAQNHFRLFGADIYKETEDINSDGQ